MTRLQTCTTARPSAQLQAGEGPKDPRGASFSVHCGGRLRIPEGGFILWEPCSRHHAEVLPGFAHYLLELGYPVSVIAHPRRLDEGVFSRLSHPLLHLNRLSRWRARLHFKLKGIGAARGVLVTTLGKLSRSGSPRSERNAFGCRKPNQAFLFVAHDVRRLVADGLWERNTLTLAQVHYAGVQSRVVNPHWFGKVNASPRSDRTTFLLAGSMHPSRRDSTAVLNGVQWLSEQRPGSFQVRVIGEDTASWLPDELEDHVRILGRVDFHTLYSELERADFLLCPFQTGNPSQDRYRTTGTSGVFQLALGFGVPCILPAPFADARGLDDRNSVLCDSLEGFARAMWRALLTTSEQRGQLRDGLARAAAAERRRSLENLKEAIDASCSPGACV